MAKSIVGRALTANVPAIAARDRAAGTPCAHGCLQKCTYKSAGERFCILEALARAHRGDVETGLVFCGANAWRSDRISTVQAIFDELFGVRHELPRAAATA